MNPEGYALLGLVISKIAGIEEEVKRGDCKVIAVVVNQVMPPGMQLTPADIYYAIKDRPDFGAVKMNAEILRARIDAMPVLYSARISGDLQAILNELNMDTSITPTATLDDVRAAMAVRMVPQPERVVQGAAGLVGRAFIG